ncbi:FG-GAP-like repeat-containing protein [Demequina sp.]|uniref:peptidoglycan DD-metalloendopeptidase family protein n=1 Tax=Demequina sp. TaxID=2050685 RepID=UPI0025E80108|nr:FG-GAP-like repeat-containing protein [Demequina sp.]
MPTRGAAALHPTRAPMRAIAVACAAIGLWAIHPAAADAASDDDAPRFSMPFACGEVWRGATRTAHSSWEDGNVTGNEYAVDFNRTGDRGMPVVASADGVAQRMNGTRTNNIRVDHGNGWFTFYAHMDLEKPLADGTAHAVSRGDVLGYVSNVGTEGPHLHYAQAVGVGTGRYRQVAASFEGHAFAYGTSLASRNCGLEGHAALSHHGVGPWNVDIDGDRAADIVRFTGLSGDQDDGGWQASFGGTAMSGWRQVFDSITAPSAREMEFGDFDGDGSTDVLRFTGERGEDGGWRVAFGTSSGRMAGWREVSDSITTPSEREMVLGDFDGDGSTDVLRFTGEQGADAGWRVAFGGAGRSMSGWRQVLDSATAPSTDEMVLGDFDGDGSTDVLRFTGDQGADAGWRVAFGGEGRGMSGWRQVLDSATAPSTDELVLGDFDGDSATDVLRFTGEQGADAGWRVAFGGDNRLMKGWRQVLDSATAPSTHELAYGDFDGDLSTDVLRFTGAEGEDGGWRLALGGEDRLMKGWRHVLNSAAAPSNREMAVGDFDGDGTTDVVKFTGTRDSGEHTGWMISDGGEQPLTAWRSARDSETTPSTREMSVTPLVG